MPIYQTFSYIEEYIVSNLPYRVSRYSQNQWFFCLFSPKIPKILRKFWKFPENSENPWTKVVNNNNSAENSKNSPKILKIRRKFLKKKVFFEALISYRIVSYREKNPHIVSISYRIEKKLIATQWPREPPDFGHWNKTYTWNGTMGDKLRVFRCISHLAGRTPAPPGAQRVSYSPSFSSLTVRTRRGSARASMK